MSWFKASFSQYAQEALSQAQASIDRALEIEPAQDPLSGFPIVLSVYIPIVNHYHEISPWTYH